MATLESIEINQDCDLAEVLDRAAPPVIALSSSSASTFAFNRVPWKHESYGRLAAEEIDTEGARIPILKATHIIFLYAIGILALEINLRMYIPFVNLIDLY
jgi:hypothetical protein